MIIVDAQVRYTTLYLVGVVVAPFQRAPVPVVRAPGKGVVQAPLEVASVPRYCKAQAPLEVGLVETDRACGLWWGGGRSGRRGRCCVKWQ